MSAILPEIVEKAAAPIDQRKAVFAIEDGGECVAVVLEHEVAEIRQRPPRLAIDESRGARIVDAFEPQARIVVGVVERGAWIQGRASGEGRTIAERRRGRRCWGGGRLCFLRMPSLPRFGMLSAGAIGRFPV